MSDPEGLPAHTYAHAARFLEPAVREHVYNVTVEPHWIGGSDRFWYCRRRRTGKEFLLVDARRGTREPAFDHARMATLLRGRYGMTCSAEDLPFDSFQIDEDGTLLFDLDDRQLRYDQQSDSLSPTEARGVTSPDRLRSPDGAWDLVLREANLLLARPGQQPSRALTTDGHPLLGYGISPDTSLTSVTNRRGRLPQPPVALWSPDSTRIVTHRLDQREVRELCLVESAPSGQGGGPVQHRYRVPLVGDDHLPLAELTVFDVESNASLSLHCLPLLVGYLSPIELGWVWWSEDGTRLYFLREGRGAKSLGLWSADAATGETSQMLEESSDSYVQPSQLLPWPSFVRVVPGSDEVIWLSERDGWAHLYSYDMRTGACLGQLTSGQWVVREVFHVDEERWIYVIGSGRVADRDPYFRNLYRVHLDDGVVEQLTPEDGDHSVAFSPSGAFFVDTWSRLDTAPISVLRRSDGSLVMTLETADLDDLTALGWQRPEPFRARARDGHTELYGVIYKPTHFDPGSSYPVIDSIYPGPQLIRTPKSFTVDSSVFPHNWPGPWDAQALAELGFVVVNVDGLGTPLRSRRFREFSYGNLGDAGGLEDHITVLRQLADNRPYMDLTRVGITGHSSGGFAAARAVLSHPDFFKVAVAASGVHDLRLYLAYWGEKYHGLPGEADYEQQANSALADQLQGNLLLIHGELDDNVHPAATLNLVDALIEADKDFGLLILPGQSHACGDHPYYIRAMWDYFVRHLLRARPPRMGVST